MFRSTPGRLSALLSLLVVALAAVTASAQINIPKAPTGPFVTQQMDRWFVNAGELVTWEVTITNPLPDALAVDFWDTPQHPECEPGGVSREWAIPADPVDGNGSETAPQSALTFLDPNGDGNCEESVLADGDGLVVCDATTQTLIIKNIAVDGAGGGFPPSPGVTTIRFVTLVDESAPSGSEVCNAGYVYDDQETDDLTDDELIQPTKDPLRMTSGCTCLMVSPPNNFDFEAEKVAVAERTPLIPNDPASTVLYTITGRNTGGDDITGAQLNDVLEPGQEWVEVVDCPPPLTCTITPPDLLTVTGWTLAGGMDPPEELSMSARATVTCGAATDDDSGEVCNQGQFAVMGFNFPTDDPSIGGLDDPTCLPVVFSDLTQSRKIDTFVDDNGNGQLDVGETVQFTVRAINRGSLAARNVVVTDDLSASTCFDPDSIVPMDGGMVAGGVVSWDLGDLPAGMVTPVEVSFTVELAATEDCCNQAFLQSDERIECGLMDPIATDDPATGATDDETCAQPGPLPDLDIDKTWALEQDVDGSGDTSQGDVVSYTITITNDPAAAGTATGASFVDPMPQCLTRLLNPLPNDLPGSMIFPNEVTTTDGTDWGTDNSVPYGGFVQPGRVQIDDLGGANGIIPGETITITFYVRALQLGLCCNDGFVTANELLEPQPTDDPATPGVAGDPTCFELPPAGPAFEFDKTVEAFDTNGDGFNNVGDLARWSLVLRSTGDVDLTNITIEDLGDSCYDVVDGSVAIEPPSAATDMTAAGSEDISVVGTGPLAPTEEFTVTFDVTWSEEGECCNQATFSSTEFTDEPSNDPDDFIAQNATCIEVRNAPPLPQALEITKTADTGAGCADPGSVVSFELLVESTGETAVDTWTVTDVLPPGLVNVMVTAPLSWDPGTRTISVDSATVGSIDPGGSETFRYTAEVPCDPVAGMARNTATAAWGSSGATDTDSVTVTWGLPDLSTSRKLLVSFDDDGNGFNDPGEPVTWDVVVVNTGTCPARDVVVTDVLDARFDETTATAPTGTVAGDTITWDSTTEPALASIAPGGMQTLSFTVEVDPATATGATIPNDVTVEATGHDVAACPGVDPPIATASGDSSVPFGEPPAATVDVLRDSDVTSLAAALGELATAVFDMPSANILTCGETRLSEAPVLVDVGATIDDGVTVDQGDGPLVFFEISELCGPEDGGAAANLLCVRKDAVGTVLLATSPDPSTCP